MSEAVNEGAGDFVCVGGAFARKFDGVFGDREDSLPNRLPEVFVPNDSLGLMLTSS